jgi:hypothetical protein
VLLRLGAKKLLLQEAKGLLQEGKVLLLQEVLLKERVPSLIGGISYEDIK